MSEIDHMTEVDQAPGVHEATESDEEQVLRGLYGDADQYGVYRGAGA